MSLALHWRAAPNAAAAVAGFAGTRIASLPGYRLQPGDHVIEFVPEGADKGLALERMMTRPPFTGRVPVFVGDDLTDECGFAAANRAGSVCPPVAAGHSTPGATSAGSTATAV